MSLFLSAFIQVCLVSLNVVFISKGLYIGVVVVAFLISFTWSFNVKKIAFGSTKDRMLYSSGAALGSVAGVYIADFLTALCK